MKLGNLRGVGFLICSLLWRTAMGSDSRDIRLGRRQAGTLNFEPVTITTTIFTQYTFTETVTMTVMPTESTASVSTPIVTVTSTEKTTITTTTTTTTTVGPKETDKRKRQLGSGLSTITSTFTLWQFPDATETLIVTATATPQAIKDFPSALPTTTTLVTTEISTVTTTAEETVTSSKSSESPSASATGMKLSGNILDGEVDDDDDGKISGPHLAIILGATFGAILGAVIVFVTAYLWTKKKRDERLEKTAYGLEGQAARSKPRGRCMKGLLGLGSVIGSTRSSARYDTLPNTDGSAMSLPNRSASPPYSPPPQLPALRVDPPDSSTFTNPRFSQPPKLPSLHITPQPGHASGFTCDYTFGSPVSSIGEARLDSLASGSGDGMNMPPLVPHTGPAVAPTTSEPPQVGSRSAGTSIVTTMSIKRKPVP